MNTQALSSGVGKGQPNLAADVKYIQQLLNLSAAATVMPVATDGVYGTQTANGILGYQMAVMQTPNPDGSVTPGGPTQTSLEAAITTPPAPAPALLQSQPVPTAVLTADDYAAAAAQLDCDPLAVQAVAQVESSGSPFDAFGRPTVLFERHVFHAQTNGLYDAAHPDISNKQPSYQTPGGYGPSALQYSKMIEAATLAADGSTLEAALLSASWGMFQVMGFNWKSVGFASIEDMVTQMRTGVSGHLQGFLGFVQANPNALKGLQTQNWNMFAAAYNGSGQVAYYGGRIQATYTALSNGG